MKYWSGKDILDRDVLEGEVILSTENPHPAYRGAKLTNGEDILYELEIIPNTERTESIIDPRTFQTVIDIVVDVLYRRWDDDTRSWDETKMPSMLKSWGYTTIPENVNQQKISKFDAAMKGI